MPAGFPQPFCEDTMTTEPFPDIMNVEEASRYLRIPRSSLYRLAQAGKLPCQKVGRHWRFRRQAIDRWLDEMPDQQEDAGEGEDQSA